MSTVRKRTSAAERLARRLRPMSNGCIEFVGARDAKGYGRIKDHNLASPGKAHRVAWEKAFGPIPAGLSVLHRCDNPPCCNPEHLFLGTKGDNTRDMVAKGRHRNQLKTHCPQGHPYIGDNLRIERTPAGGVARRCAICRLATQRNYRQRKAAS